MVPAFIWFLDLVVINVQVGVVSLQHIYGGWGGGWYSPLLWKTLSPRPLPLQLYQPHHPARFWFSPFFSQLVCAFSGNANSF